MWFAFNAEAIHNVTAFYPYDFCALMDPCPPPFSLTPSALECALRLTDNGPISVNNGLLFRQLFAQSLVRNSTCECLSVPTHCSDMSGCLVNSSTLAPTALVDIYLLPPATSNPVTPTSLVIIPVFKPSTLVAPPVSMCLLTATGEKNVDFVLNESGLSFPASDVIAPAPVPLLTYFKNYTAESLRHAGRLALHLSPKDSLMPTPGRLQRRSGEIGVLPRRGATGSVPYARLYGNASTGSVAVTDLPSLVDRTPCGLRGCSVYTAADYVLVRSEGTCYATALLPGGAPAVPVVLWWNGVDDNLGAPTAPADGQSWSDVDTECWVYVSQNTDSTLLPLELWHSAKFAEYWTLADPASRAEAISEGYVRVSTLGFVEPATGLERGGDPDPATVASWAYVLRVDW